MLGEVIIPIIVNILTYACSLLFFSKYLVKKAHARPIWLALAAVLFAVILYFINTPRLPLVNMPAAIALNFILETIFFKGRRSLLLVLSVIIVTIGSAAELIVSAVIILLAEIGPSSLFGVDNLLSLLDATAMANLSQLITAFLYALTLAILTRVFHRKLTYFRNKDLVLVAYPVFSLCLSNALLYMTQGTTISHWGNLILILLLFGLLLSSALVFFIYVKIIEDYAVKEENRLLQSQIDSYQYQFEQIKESQAVIGRIEHDIEKHLLALKMDLKNAMPAEAEQKIDALIGNLRLAENVADSGNADVDAILNYKAMQASAFGIRMACDLRLPYTLSINTTDLTIILGNALDNAIEACKTVESSEREISITINYDKHNLSMAITNPFTGEIKTDAAGELITTKKKGRHGIGLKSIQEVVEKYDGLMDASAENNRFTLKILLFNLRGQ